MCKLMSSSLSRTSIKHQNNYIKGQSNLYNISIKQYIYVKIYEDCITCQSDIKSHIVETLDLCSQRVHITDDFWQVKSQRCSHTFTDEVSCTQMYVIRNVHRQMFKHTYTHTQTHTHTNTHTHTHVYRKAYTQMFTHMYVNRKTLTPIHTRSCSQTDVHTCC